MSRPEYALWNREPASTVRELNERARLHAMGHVYAAGIAVVIPLNVIFGAVDWRHHLTVRLILSMGLCGLSFGIGALYLRKAWTCFTAYKAAHPLTPPPAAP